MVAEHRIRVIMRDTGGGFGQKVQPLREELCLMLAAPRLAAPIKWIEDRRENLLAAGQARHEHASDGGLLAPPIFSLSGAGEFFLKNLRAPKKGLRIRLLA